MDCIHKFYLYKLWVQRVKTLCVCVCVCVRACVRVVFRSFPHFYPPFCDTEERFFF
jgi:hypothetical protein